MIEDIHEKYQRKQQETGDSTPLLENGDLNGSADTFADESGGSEITQREDVQEEEVMQVTRTEDGFYVRTLEFVKRISDNSQVRKTYFEEKEKEEDFAEDSPLRLLDIGESRNVHLAGRDTQDIGEQARQQIAPKIRQVQRQEGELEQVLYNVTRVGEEECHSVYVRPDNQFGVHARPATMIVKTGSRYDLDYAIIEKNGEKVSALSIIGIMGLEWTRGQVGCFRAKGIDAEKYLRDISFLFKRKFDED